MLFDCNVKVINYWAWSWPGHRICTFGDCTGMSGGSTQGASRSL